MNMKLKALVVAAVASMAMSGAASAAIKSSAGGELFVVAFDSGSQNTFVATLDSIASTAASFTGTSNLSTSFASDANWTTFMSGVTGSVNYQVLGLDTNSKSVWTTSNNMGTNAGANSAYNALSASGSSIQNWLGYYTGTGASSSFVAAGANGNETQISDTWNNFLNKFSTTADLGTNDNFYKLTKVGTSTATPLAITTYTQTDGSNAYWNLSANGNLTYTAAVAAVPEADTWAMMLAGLGLMGFIARRRTAA